MSEKSIFLLLASALEEAKKARKVLNMEDFYVTGNAKDYPTIHSCNTPACIAGWGILDKKVQGKIEGDYYLRQLGSGLNYLRPSDLIDYVSKQYSQSLAWAIFDVDWMDRRERAGEALAKGDLPPDIMDHPHLNRDTNSFEDALDFLYKIDEYTR